MHVIRIQMSSGNCCTTEILCTHRLKKVRGNRLQCHWPHCQGL